MMYFIYLILYNIQFRSVQSLCHVQLFETPWTAAHQASLSITNSQTLLKLMSTEWVMPSTHLILCHTLLLFSDCQSPVPSSVQSLPGRAWFLRIPEAVSSQVIPADWKELRTETIWDGWPDEAGWPLPPVCGRVHAQGTRTCVARWGGLALPPVCGRSLPREPGPAFH